jgi:hypothetical protein
VRDYLRFSRRWAKPSTGLSRTRGSIRNQCLGANPSFRPK